MKKTILSIFLFASAFCVSSQKNPSVSAGDLRAEIGNGTLSLYKTTLEGKEKALLSVADKKLSAFFSVVAFGREFRSTSPGFSLEKINEENSAKMTFSDGNRFKATLSLNANEDRKKSVWLENEQKDEFDEDKKPSCIRADFTVENLSGARARFSLRSFFDTTLGDNAKTPFESASGAEYRKETQISPKSLLRQVALRSTDGENFLGFAFEKDFPSATVANRDVLLREFSREGGIRFLTGRSFSSATSYLNSAIAFSWDDFILEKGASKTFPIYISIGKVKQNVVVRYVEIEKNEEENPVQTVEKSDEKQESSEEKTNVDFTVSNLKDYQLDPAYIQSLIDRISLIRSGAVEPIDQAEIQRLNAELDAILARLKQEQNK